MSLIVETSLTWIQQICVNILKTGHVPKHVAFIMDGNRRYARKSNIEKVEGHCKGFDKLSNILQWCNEVGINEITVYAFSIDDFKRTKAEVDGLMKLTNEKFEGILEDRDKIMSKGICIRIIGNLKHLSPELKKLVAQIVIMTKNNNKCFLNIALSYSSRDEITNSIKCVMDGVSEGLINTNDIDEKLLSNCMYTNKSPDPDLLIRTSGEMRFSDFLLWQISCTQVIFSDVLWPEMSIWHLLSAIFKYQTNYNYMQSVQNAKNNLENNNNNTRIDKFLDALDKSRRQQLESYIHV